MTESQNLEPSKRHGVGGPATAEEETICFLGDPTAIDEDTTLVARKSDGVADPFVAVAMRVREVPDGDAEQVLELGFAIPRFSGELHR